MSKEKIADRIERKREEIDHLQTLVAGININPDYPAAHRERDQEAAQSMIRRLRQEISELQGTSPHGSDIDSNKEGGKK